MNTKYRRRSVAALATLALNASAGSVSAATTSTTFQVTATVASACTVSANNLAFGTYVQTAGVNTDATTTVTVNCSLSTGYNIGLDEGTGTGATVSDRIMSDGSSNELNYTLYSNALRTTLWGNTVGSDTVSGTGLGVAHTVYGRVFSDQSDTAPVGSYSDTITVTVTY
jgi:spore coat protein U-like protein